MIKAFYFQAEVEFFFREIFHRQTILIRAVVMEDRSASSPSTPMIQVRILLPTKVSSQQNGSGQCKNYNVIIKTPYIAMKNYMNCIHSHLFSSVHCCNYDVVIFAI